MILESVGPASPHHPHSSCPILCLNLGFRSILAHLPLLLLLPTASRLPLSLCLLSRHRPPLCWRSGNIGLYRSRYPCSAAFCKSDHLNSHLILRTATASPSPGRFCVFNRRALLLWFSLLQSAECGNPATAFPPAPPAYISPGPNGLVKPKPRLSTTLQRPDNSYSFV